MIAKRFSIRELMVILFFVFISACATPKVELNLSSTTGLNMDSSEHPLPVVVQIYQLTDAKAFEKATFNELWKNEQTVLGNTLLHKDSITLDPDSHQEIRFDRHAQTRFVAVMAAFNNQTDNSWRVLKEVKGSFLGIKRSSRINVVLKEKTIEITDK
jgi:type VI secretion system protein VasD